MQELKELHAFAAGYLEGTKSNAGPIEHADEWIVWGKYDINLAGAQYAPDITRDQLRVNVYRAGWGHELPEPLHTFTTGE